MSNDIKIKAGEGSKAIGVWRFLVRDTITGKTREYVIKNLIPTAGREQIAKALEGTIATVSDIKITHTSLGTGTNAPANSDTQLQTETFRKVVASSTHSLNQLFITAFYAANEGTPSTHREAGLHIGATATPNSGTLFSRVAINITRSVTETLTIDYTITFT